MWLIPNEQNTHSSKIYEKVKEPENIEAALQIVCRDEAIQKLGLNREDLREKLINFKKETGKHAVWERRVTEAFRQYLTGQKVYKRSKELERISFYLSEQRKKTWSEFLAKNKDYSSFSKLIRESVDYYIKHHSNFSTNESKIDDQNLSNIYFTIKESLTAIKGFSQLLLKEYREEFNSQVIDTMEKIIEQCIALELKVLNNREEKNVDVILIEDEKPTRHLFKVIFKNKGCSYTIARTGQRGLEELKKSSPKLVLLDIMLPDIDGYEICKQIKKNGDLNHIRVFYVTARDEEEVKSRIEETGADGYILKPPDLEIIDQLLDSVVITTKKEKKGGVIDWIFFSKWYFILCS